MLCLLHLKEEEEVPWIRVGLIVTLTGLQGHLSFNQQFSCTDNRMCRTFGALVSPISPSTSIPTLLVDQDNCIPVIEWEDMNPFGTTSMHQIIRGDEQDREKSEDHSKDGQVHCGVCG